MFINYHVQTNVYKCISSYVCTDLRVIKYMFVRSFEKDNMAGRLCMENDAVWILFIFIL